MTRYTLEDLRKAEAERDAIEERWSRYEGNNPGKYEADRRAARDTVRVIKESLKANGIIEMSDAEKLNARLDNEFPNAKSKEVVELDGVKYRRRFFPAEKSRSGKTVTRWERTWEKLS